MYVSEFVSEFKSETVKVRDLLANAVKDIVDSVKSYYEQLKDPEAWAENRYKESISKGLYTDNDGNEFPEEKKKFCREICAKVQTAFNVIGWYDDENLYGYEKGNNDSWQKLIPIWTAHNAILIKDTTPSLGLDGTLQPDVLDAAFSMLFEDTSRHASSYPKSYLKKMSSLCKGEIFEDLFDYLNVKESGTKKSARALTKDYYYQRVGIDNDEKLEVNDDPIFNETIEPEEEYNKKRHEFILSVKPGQLLVDSDMNEFSVKYINAGKPGDPCVVYDDKGNCYFEEDIDMYESIALLKNEDFEVFEVIDNESYEI